MRDHVKRFYAKTGILTASLLIFMDYFIWHISYVFIYNSEMLYSSFAV